MSELSLDRISKGDRATSSHRSCQDGSYALSISSLSWSRLAT